MLRYSSAHVRFSRKVHISMVTPFGTVSNPNLNLNTAGFSVHFDNLVRWTNTSYIFQTAQYWNSGVIHLPNDHLFYAFGGARLRIDGEVTGVDIASGTFSGNFDIIISDTYAFPDPYFVRSIVSNYQYCANRLQTAKWAQAFPDECQWSASYTDLPIGESFASPKPIQPHIVGVPPVAPFTPEKVYARND